MLRRAQNLKKSSTFNLTLLIKWKILSNFSQKVQNLTVIVEVIIFSQKFLVSDCVTRFLPSLGVWKYPVPVNPAYNVHTIYVV